MNLELKYYKKKIIQVIPIQPPTKLNMFAVDSSIEKISKVLCKMGVDDLPVETQPDLATAIQQETQI
jgi:hypothetical protein